MRYKNIKQLIQESKQEDQDLFEVKMTSKNLAKLARSVPDVKVGLEFEMIVPNTDAGSEEQEPDYEQDERIRDIDDACNFFDDGDYNGRNEIRRLREAMENDYMDWKFEKLAELWDRNGFEFFKEYLDREEPFDEEDYLEQAIDMALSENPGLESGTDEYDDAVREKLEEINASYYVDQWEEQGRNYDYAQEEFNDEQSDEITESDWLDDQGFRFASDIENNYQIMWPYWTSSGGETDAKEVALNFMNYMGYDTIAVGEYHGYGGGYQLWNGSEWVKIGSNKPMDAFTVEPDGSLSGDSSSDTGLEFVSPPIPLDQIGETMRKVQAWASENGAYTGKRNATSMHTNISIPGYDLKNLDYLKAALLLGDEHVLRQFDRIGNTYAKPAIEKIKNLVQQKPEKAQELLDLMKSKLNAEASKLIHSGQTDKYTSINTKDNRVEFRSPGGDYLSIIADNPQKMIDTINRMVVTLDAAMDPDKYKEEYQKKLYKMLTGQGGGREAKTGVKKEIKASDKDLLNIFSRYAAGEMPKAALKSFVRQAQLERNIKAGKTGGEEFKWEVGRPGYGASIIVNAKTREEAIDRALQPDGYPDWASARSQLTAKPIGPANTDAVKARAGEPQPVGQQSNQGNWGIWMLGADRFANQPGEYPRGATPPLYRFPTRAAAEQWIEQQRSSRPRMRADIEVREIEPAEPIPGSTLDLQRRRAAAAQQSQPAGEQSSYELYRVSDGRTVTAPAGNPIQFLATSPEDAESKIERYVSDFGLGSVSSYAVRSVINAPTQEPATKTYELYNRGTGEVIETFPARNDNEAMTRLNDFRDFSALARQNPQWDVGVRQQVSSRAQQPADQAPAVPTDNWSQDFERRMQPSEPQPLGAGRELVGWKIVDPQGRTVHEFSGIGNVQADANNYAIRWLRQNPRYLQGGVEVVPNWREA